ncbi:uncharacterized protein LOC143276726 [Babylonia areolata]|uniref:uncharacterized protein LOC143276726 n=1 Tax=Babylonia areolata TaxID=304850 RepID=UPI003FCF99F8
MACPDQLAMSEVKIEIDVAEEAGPLWMTQDQTCSTDDRTEILTTTTPCETDTRSPSTVIQTDSALVIKTEPTDHSVTDDTFHHFQSKDGNVDIKRESVSCADLPSSSVNPPNAVNSQPLNLWNKRLEVNFEFQNKSVKTNISSDVIKTEPAITNISSDVIKTEPATTNISSDVIKTEDNRPAGDNQLQGKVQSSVTTKTTPQLSASEAVRTPLHKSANTSGPHAETAVRGSIAVSPPPCTAEPPIPPPSMGEKVLVRGGDLCFAHPGPSQPSLPTGGDSGREATCFAGLPAIRPVSPAGGGRHVSGGSGQSACRSSGGTDNQVGPDLPLTWPGFSLHGGQGAIDPWGWGHRMAGTHGWFPPFYPYWGAPIVHAGLPGRPGANPSSSPSWIQPSTSHRVTHVASTSRIDYMSVRLSSSANIASQSTNRASVTPQVTSTVTMASSSGPTAAESPRSARGSLQFPPPQPSVLQGDEWVFVPSQHSWVPLASRDALTEKVWHPPSQAWLDLRSMHSSPSSGVKEVTAAAMVPAGNRPSSSRWADHSSHHAPAGTSTWDGTQQGMDWQQDWEPLSSEENEQVDEHSSPPSQGDRLSPRLPRNQPEPNSDLAELELTLPDRVTHAESVPQATLSPLALLRQCSSNSRTTRRLRVPEMAQEWFNKPACTVRGAASIPPPGRESLSAPGAFPLGKFLKDSSKGGVWSLYTQDHPAYMEAEPSTQDRMLVSQHSTFPTSANLSFKTLAEWDRLARRCLLEVSTAYTFFDAFLHRANELWEQRLVNQDTGSPSSVPPGLFTDQRLNTFGNRVASGLTAAADTATSLHFNTVLARRDAVLRLSNIPLEERAALRSIPAQQHSLFGQYGPHFVSHRAVMNREVASYSAPTFQGRRGSRPLKKPATRAPPYATPFKLKRRAQNQCLRNKPPHVHPSRLAMPKAPIQHHQSSSPFK